MPRTNNYPTVFALPFPRLVFPIFGIALLLPAYISTGLFAAVSPTEHPGAVIYRNQCAECHGAKGEGVTDLYDEPLIGKRSLSSLERYIVRAMPEDNEEACIGPDAKAVTAYIYDAFYSPQAQAKHHPRPKIAFSRLTTSQYQQSVADIIDHFRRPAEFSWTERSERGLVGYYYGTQKFRGDEEKDGSDVFERTDPQVKFDFGTRSPDPEKIGPDEFSVKWSGALIAPETGSYDFIIRTQNGAKLHLNDKRNPLIDAWVSQGKEPRDERASVYLIAGRAYFLELSFFSYKEETASIELLWKPPHGVRQPVPERHLAPYARIPETLVITTPFPADDSSEGYARGTSVSRGWHEAVTNAALEVSSYVLRHLNELSRYRENDPGRRKKLKHFCSVFAAKAFRRHLDDAEWKRVIGAPFENNEVVEKAVRSSLLLALMAPQFLYPESTRGNHVSPDSLKATRLALAIWDSVPNKTLTRAAKKRKLSTRAQVLDQARQMLGNPRARTKIDGFFHHWLEMERGESVSKDKEAFPGFDEALLADLRTSLTLFLDEVVWGDSPDYRRLLSADYLFLNARLAKFYNSPDRAQGGKFEKITFDGARRSGIITHPFLLTTMAYHKTTSPIHRGVFLTRNIAGIPMKPPPDDIEFEEADFDPSLTMREKVTEVTRANSCMACHATINPFGFSLENYDAVGRWRTEDNKKPVDTRGDLVTEEGEKIVLNGARDVAEFAASSPLAQRAFVVHLFNHLTKQPPVAYGEGTTDALLAIFRASDFNIRELIVQIATTAATLEPPAAGKAVADD